MFRYNQDMPPEINQCNFSKAMYKPLKPVQLKHNWSLSPKTSVGHQTNSVENQISDNVLISHMYSSPKSYSPLLSSLACPLLILLNKYYFRYSSNSFRSSNKFVEKRQNKYTIELEALILPINIQKKKKKNKKTKTKAQ